MADVDIKRGDSWPPVDAVLSDQDGPIDLTTATSVKLLFKTTTGSTAYSRVCTVTDALGGEVRYIWTLADAASGPTSAVNSFNIEWEITWSDGTVTTVPNVGYKTLSVVADLG
jgi:hypothetical protein